MPLTPDTRRPRNTQRRPGDGARLPRQARREDRYAARWRHVPGYGKLEPAWVNMLGWCRGAELNCLRRPFQGRALPVSYLGTGTTKDSTEKPRQRKGKSAGVNLPQRRGDTEDKKLESRKSKLEKGNPSFDLNPRPSRFTPIASSRRTLSSSPWFSGLRGAWNRRRGQRCRPSP